MAEAIELDLLIRPVSIDSTGSSVWSEGDGVKGYAVVNLPCLQGDNETLSGRGLVAVLLRLLPRQLREDLVARNATCCEVVMMPPCQTSCIDTIRAAIFAALGLGIPVAIRASNLRPVSGGMPELHVLTRAAAEAEPLATSDSPKVGCE